MDTKIKENSLELSLDRKKARAAMCKASLLLFAFALFSSALGVFMTYVGFSFTDEVQDILVKIICFFGVSGQMAVAAARMFVTSPAVSAFMNMITVLFTIVLPAYIFSKAANVNSKNGFGMKGKASKAVIPVFCVTQLLCSAVIVFSSGISQFLLPDADYSAQSVVGANSQFDVFGLIMQIICICIVVPLAEEYAFRGVVFGYLKRYGLSFGIVASAFVFGISHSSPTQSVYAFMFGIVAGIVTCLTGNLKTAVVLHFLNNLTIVLQENMRLLLDEKIENIIYCVFMLFVFGFSFYGLYRIVKKDGLQDMYNSVKEQNDRALSYVPTAKDIFVFPVVVYVLIYALSFLADVQGW